MSSNPYFQFHMQGNCWLVAYTEDLKRAILFHNLAFISQKHLVPFQIGKKEEKKKCQKRKKIKLVNHLFCFKIVLAKQMQKKKKKSKWISTGFFLMKVDSTYNWHKYSEQSQLYNYNAIMSFTCHCRVFSRLF